MSSSNDNFTFYERKKAMEKWNHDENKMSPRDRIIALETMEIVLMVCKSTEGDGIVTAAFSKIFDVMKHKAGFRG